MRLGLRDNLEFEGYEVDWAEDGEEGLAKMEQKGPFNLIILDVMMPRMSGFDVLKAMRNRKLDTPVILLTAKGEEIDKVLGLELGADDYITKPFSLRELLARVKAVMRRFKSDEDEQSPAGEVAIGKLVVNFGSFTAASNGKAIKMSHKEVEVLQYLWKHKNQAVSRYNLLEDIWGYEESPTTRTVDNFIVKLRQKIEANPNSPVIILTVHGVGYKMVL